MELVITTEKKGMPEAAALHEHGGDIYSYKNVRDFSANINFRGMPETVRLAAQEAVTQSIHYPDPRYRTLRAVLAERESEICRKQETLCEDVMRQDILCEACRIHPHQILCGNGAAELMFALAAARRPAKALLAAPSFFEYEQALSAFGCEIRRFYLKKEQEFRLEKSFLEAIEEGTDLIILGNPNNPTGQVLQTDFLEKLMQICLSRQILLVLDESFFDFLDVVSCQETFSGVSRVTENPNIFVMKSFTKMYAMPGLRFGYGVCSDTRLLDQMRFVMQPWNVSIPAQMAAQAAAKELEFAAASATETAENRSELSGALEKAGYQVYPSAANFLLLEGPEDLRAMCLDRGFLIRDCSNFPGLEKGFFRVCVRSEKENQMLFAVLKECKETKHQSKATKESNAAKERTAE